MRLPFSVKSLYAGVPANTSFESGTIAREFIGDSMTALMTALLNLLDVEKAAVEKRVSGRFAALICALTLCALATLPVANANAVKLLMSWKNPAYSGQKPHRILVIGMSENPEIRADFEDDLSLRNCE